MYFLNSDFYYFYSFIIGIFGSAHCIGMCGGISIIISSNLPKKNFIYFVFSYNFGRIISYSIIGFIAGYFGFFLLNFFGDFFIYFFKILSSLSLLLIGLYLIDIFKTFSFVENFGLKIWIKFNFLFKKFLPIKNFFHSFLIGIIWGQIPCGLVYSVLIWSLSYPSYFDSMLIMFFFGLGTLPSMILTGHFHFYLKKTINKKLLRYFFGIFFIFLSVLMIFNVILFKSCH